MVKSNLKKQKNKSKIQDVFDIGTKYVCKNFVAYFLLPTEETFSSTIIASKKTGNAVKRNKAKRRLREITRLYIKPCTPSIRLIIIARVNTYKAEYSSIMHDCNILINKIHNKS